MLEIEPLPQKFIEILNEDPEQLERDVETLRDWLLKQPHLCLKNDDQFLVNMIRGCKYSLEKCKIKANAFCAGRSSLPDVFTNRNVNDPRIHKLIKMGVFIPLNIKSIHPRVFILRVGVHNPAEFRLEEVSKSVNLLGDMISYEDNMLLIASHKALFDMSNITAAHLMQCEPSLLKKLVAYHQDGNIASVKEIHVINAPTALYYFVDFVKQFCNQKIQSRFRIHKNLDSLYEFIPKKILPSEYGGEAGSISEIMEKFIDSLKKSKDIIAEMDKFGVDESKRLDNTPMNDNLYGNVGSFRKLNID